MNRHRIILNLGLFLIFINWFNSSGQTTSFSTQKKSIDTLIIIRPIVTVVADDKKTQNFDYELTRNNEELINKTTLNLLSSKYKLREIDNLNYNKDSIISLCNKADNFKKGLTGYSIKPFLYQNEDESKKQFGLLLVYTGEINPNYLTHNNIKAGMATNSIIYNPAARPHSDLILMVIDFKEQKIIFYDRKKSSDKDPRVPEEIEQMTKLLLKSIYYK